jgi:hypothetical protein
MKIRRVAANQRRRAFDVVTARTTYSFPFAKLRLQPTPTNKIKKAYVDRELGNEAFTYVLESGEEDTVHLDDVLYYNEDPGYMRDLLLHKLTVEAQKRVERSPLSRRELIRRLRTSATQFYRLLDPTNYKKSVDQLLTLLRVLDCDVDLVIKDRAA